MLKAIIIDDEEDARVVLSMLINKYCTDIKIIGMADSVETAKSILSNKTPDILFLDIEMPGASGFDLLATFTNSKWSVIFTTAHDQYALKALKCSAVDYLLKPIIVTELKEAIEKVKQQNNFQQEKIDALLSNKEKIKKIGLPLKGQVIFRSPEEIIYCEANSNYTVVHTNKEEKILVSKTLKEYETLLEDSHFYRIHHSFLININHIKCFHFKTESVTMTNEIELPVSRRKKATFFNKYQDILFKSSKN